MSAIGVYQHRLKVVRLTTAAKVTALFDQLPNLDRPAAEPFARKVAPLVAAGQINAAKLTNAHIARAANTASARIDPATVTGPAARRGVELIDEYQRPFGVGWGALADGHTIEEARAIARNRLDVLAVTDIWLASRAMAEVIDQANPKITGWVRVADADACDLCAAADGTPTTAAADFAGHPGCGCTQEPTFSDAKPSTPADPEATDVHEHDELGPVLYGAGDRFTPAR